MAGIPEKREPNATQYKHSCPGLPERPGRLSFRLLDKCHLELDAEDRAIEPLTHRTIV